MRRIYASVICVSVGSGNGLLPVRRQAIIWSNADLLSIGPLWTTSMKLKSKYKTFHKMHLKMSYVKIVAILSRGRLVKDFVSTDTISLDTFDA